MALLAPWNTQMEAPLALAFLALEEQRAATRGADGAFCHPICELHPRADLSEHRHNLLNQAEIAAVAVQFEDRAMVRAPGCQKDFAELVGKRRTQRAGVAQANGIIRHPGTEHQKQEGRHPPLRRVLPSGPSKPGCFEKFHLLYPRAALALRVLMAYEW
jgi:hypothetical protein